MPYLVFILLMLGLSEWSDGSLRKKWRTWQKKRADNKAHDSASDNKGASPVNGKGQQVEASAKEKRPEQDKAISNPSETTKSTSTRAPTEKAKQQFRWLFHEAYDQADIDGHVKDFGWCFLGILEFNIENIYANKVRDDQFSWAKYGGENLLDVLANFPDLVAISLDNKKCRNAIPARELFEWSSWGGRDGFDRAIEQLAKKWATHEMWTIDGQKNEVLKSYIAYTFFRLLCQNKIAVKSGQIAAFNTGLMNDSHNWIYAIFKPSSKFDKSKTGAAWRFDRFTLEADEFGSIKLETASYNERPEDIIYNGGDIVRKDDHIIVERMHRLPLSLFESAMTESIRSTLHLCANDDFDRLNRFEKNKVIKERRDFYDKNPKVYCHILDALDNAIDVAKRKVRADYTVAVPTYYPKFNRVDLILPLALCPKQIDCALLIQRQEDNGEKEYIARTILTLDMAYNNARIIRRPDSPWLNAAISE